MRKLLAFAFCLLSWPALAQQAGPIVNGYDPLAVHPGAITGAIKGTGAAAACADLSNGATGCSTATGTSGATLPLLNGANTWSGVQTFGAHVVSGGTALSCSDLAFGTGGGTSPTCTSVTGDDHRVIVSFSTGTTPGTSAVVWTITFKAAYASAPNCLLAEGNVNAATKITGMWPTTTTTTLVLNAGAIGLTASTAYIVNLQCIG